MIPFRLCCLVTSEFRELKSEAVVFAYSGRYFARVLLDSKSVHHTCLFHCRKLMNIAFNDLNPFPMKMLRNRRSMHREELEAELCELQQIKAAYVKERAEQGPQDLKEVVSEEEEEN